MSKINNNTQYRFDIICAKDNGLALVKFCRDNGISVNSMINHLIVSFLLNKHKYAFNFVDGNDTNEQQVNNQQQNNIHEASNDSDDDNDNFPAIIQQLLNDKDNGDNLDYSF
jgi:hypothetical protein